MGLMKNNILMAFLLILLMTSCAKNLTIRDITTKPESYRNQAVNVEGIVVETIVIPLTGKGIYQLKDDTGKIWVQPANDVPFRGETVNVMGEVKIGLSIFDKNFGVIIVEQKQ